MNCCTQIVNFGTFRFASDKVPIKVKVTITLFVNNSSKPYIYITIGKRTHALVQYQLWVWLCSTNKGYIIYIYISKAELTCLHSCCCQDMGRDGEGGGMGRRRGWLRAHTSVARWVFSDNSQLSEVTLHARTAGPLPFCRAILRGGGGGGLTVTAGWPWC